MDELVDALEGLNALIEKIDDQASLVGFPAPLMDAKAALEEALEKLEDYVNAD